MSHMSCTYTALHRLFRCLQQSMRIDHHGLNPSDAKQFRWSIPSCFQWRCHCRPGQGPLQEQAHLRFCKHPYCDTGICTAGSHRQQESAGSGQLPLQWQSCLFPEELQLLMQHLYRRKKTTLKMTHKTCMSTLHEPNVELQPFPTRGTAQHCWRVIRLGEMQHGTVLSIASNETFLDPNEFRLD